MIVECYPTHVRGSSRYLCLRRLGANTIPRLLGGMKLFFTCSGLLTLEEIQTHTIHALLNMYMQLFTFYCIHVAKGLIDAKCFPGPEVFN